MGSTNEASEKLGKHWFRNFALQIIAELATNTPVLTKAFVDSLKADLPGAADQDWKIWVQKLADKGYFEQDTADLLKPIEEYPFPLDLITAVMVRIGIMKGEVDSMTNIFSLDRQYKAMHKTTPHPAPVEMLIRSMIIDPKRTTENRDELKKHGFDNTQIDNMILAHYKTVDEGTLRTLFLRGIIDEAKLFERMFELGYTETRIKEIVQTWDVIPGPGDLFTMVAKEAFEPEMVTKLGLGVEFPVEQLPWLKKQGISEYWAKHYWYAHWDQPSIGQGFEMLHRGVIDKATLDLLFRAVEIPSFWRDKLTQVAYNPYTRVDARRMHAVGTLETAELHKAYTDIGYDSDKADKMVDFTLKFNMGPEKELTRGAILSSYESGLINRTTAKDLLISQDYSATLADYYLTMSDFNISKETQDLLFENIRQKFLIYKLTTTQATSSLSKMGLDSNRISALLANWDLTRYQYELLPSKSELEDFLLNGLISEAQYRGVMKQHGYDAAAINWYIARINLIEPTREKMPTKSELERFLRKKIINEEQYRVRMETLGYSKFHIDAYLYEMKIIKVIPVEIILPKTLTKAELGRFLSKEIMSEVEYRAEMKILGYSDEVITQFEIEVGKPPSRVDLTRFVKERLITVNQYTAGMILLGYTRKDITLYLKEITLILEREEI